MSAHDIELFEYEKLIEMMDDLMSLTWKYGIFEFREEMYPDESMDSNYLNEKYDQFSKNFNEYWCSSDRIRKQKLIDWTCKSMQ